ncbi:MAG: MmcQ/YjbR family DNA-binding protein [Methanomassiliicoccaceae archaeon]|nr:MmcQ/YjbR family DNA-binding protein [Methanomassiliicoccaceae archaeon]
MSDADSLPDSREAVFKSEYAQRVIKYVKERYNDELQFLWVKFPKNAVFRRKDNKKWYAALLVLEKRKLGVDSEDVVDIIDLRAMSEDIDHLLDGEGYFPGYHMNKDNWITICLDGSVPIDEIYDRIDESYYLTALQNQTKNRT